MGGGEVGMRGQESVPGGRDGQDQGPGGEVTAVQGGDEGGLGGRGQRHPDGQQPAGQAGQHGTSRGSG